MFYNLELELYNLGKACNQSYFFVVKEIEILDKKREISDYNIMSA